MRTRLAPPIYDGGVRSLQTRNADRKREKQQDMGWRPGRYGGRDMVQEEDSNRGRQKQGQGKGSREQKARRGQGLGGAGTNLRDREGGGGQQNPREVEKEWAPPSSAASVSGWALASSKPLLKLLHVGA